jgi:hypothetical protein
MAAPLVIEQPSAGDDPDRIGAALTAVFVAAREAVLDQRPVVLLLDDRDLLGQGAVGDAGVATGMLGLARALALEGAKPGWRVNVVSHRGGDDAGAVEDAVAWVGGSELSGQLIRVGTDHLGRVWP